MKITFEKNPENKFEIKMVGNLAECNVVIEALENSVNETKPVNEATRFLRKKLNELAGRR
jgi:hypothetical protein